MGESAGGAPRRRAGYLWENPGQACFPGLEAARLEAGLEEFR